MVQTYDDLAGSERIDSRDLIEVLEALRVEVEEDGRDEDERDEMREQIAAIEAIEDCCEDWPYGAALIREDTFEDYAQEFAEDIGAISSDAQWPLYCIDWERAACELAVDYTSVEFAGHSYYVR